MNNTSPLLKIQWNLVALILFITLFAGRCNRGLKAIEEEKARQAAVAKRTKNLIGSIKGIGYTEVRRKFDNGLSFSPVGYQLIPEWRISFPSNDSVNIFSPKKNKFLNAPVVFDHDSIFSIAWAWLKLQHLSKDSLKFMVIHVDDHNVIIDEKTHVFMTFYANDYIKNVLHSDTNNLWRPGVKDSLYIKQKVDRANANLIGAFAGTQPVTLTSRNPSLTVNKELESADYAGGGKIYDDYLSPTFNITIHHAYTDFSYSYSAFVDQKGTITFRKSITFLYPEFVKPYTEAMKGITDSYLKLYLKTTPAKTLGMAHSSIIILNVVGYKSQ
jgi:hypothetical protein